MPAVPWQSPGPFLSSPRRHTTSPAATAAARYRSPPHAPCAAARVAITPGAPWHQCTSRSLSLPRAGSGRVSTTLEADPPLLEGKLPPGKAVATR